jgi:hypothetical protein
MASIIGLARAARRWLDAADLALAWMPALVDRRLWPALKAMLDDPGSAHSVESLAGRFAK